MREYQVEPLRAIVKSIREKAGLNFVVIFPRQSGKNEAQLALYTYLLTHAQSAGGDIIHVEPTYKPQTETAMFRLQKKLSQCSLTRGKWRKMFGYIYAVGLARVVHFSGEPTANVVGSTAGLLLSINEAQDITTQKFDKDFRPMGASVNATTVFWGTRWTSDTLLEREHKSALAAQEADGIKRVFFVTAEDVTRVLPVYGDFVKAEVQRLGREHPLVKTQYYCECIDAVASMFNPGRIMLMRGSHAAKQVPTPGITTAFLIDVGGQDERSLDPEQLDNSGRDSTTLTICEIDVTNLAQIGFPVYRIVHRRAWQGERHVTVAAQVKQLYQLWRPIYMIIDATGVGEGLWSMLDQAMPGRVYPVKFTEQEKSAIGYQWLQVIDTGRYQEYSPLDETFLQQAEKCRSEVKPGPAKSLRWGVPDSMRAADGDYLHDDYLLSAALVAILDRMTWMVSTAPAGVDGFDPITFK